MQLLENADHAVIIVIPATLIMDAKTVLQKILNKDGLTRSILILVLISNNVKNAHISFKITRPLAMIKSILAQKKIQMINWTIVLKRHFKT
ncbi:UNKNOWN [Stylonychia lemnae]|uniref:Uncharacterized protein n=1 Tax=Stylonychia lemnae TaxID=5949 RepID=A0A078AIL3_STYLE|nr:UNKNOWN [Stylonychia lemnae]|eukprot:CDW81776.1 UNKNOWN [Stylonychia lemnae]